MLRLNVCIYTPRRRASAQRTRPHRRHAPGGSAPRAARKRQGPKPQAAGSRRGGTRNGRTNIRDVARQHDPAKRPRLRRTRAASSPASRSRARVAPSARSRAAFPACTRVPARGDQCIVIRRQSIERGLVLVTLVLVPVRAPAGRLAFRLACSFVSHFRPWGT